MAEVLAEAERAIELALAKGAEGAQASVDRGRSTDFSYRDGQLETVQESSSHSLVLRLYVDGRYSAHSTNDLRPESLATFVEDAVALTRALEPDPHRALPEPALYAGRAEVDLELFDRSAAAVDRETALAWLEELDAAARDHARIVSATGRLHVAEGTGAMASSNGLAGVEEGTALWYGSEVTARDEGDRRPEAAVYRVARHRADLPSPREVAALARDRALERIGAEKGPSARTAMVVHPEASGSLIGRVLGALGAGAIQQKRSFLADRLGEPVASAALTLHDEPLRPRGLGSRRFDGEGIAARPRPIVEGGVLQLYFVDTYYGRKLGWEPTTGSASNVVFGGGARDLEAIVADLDEGYLVEGWLGGNADPTTGDFSFGVRGWRVAGGVRREPVSEMNVTGNFTTLLAALAETGNDPNRWSSIQSPTMVFEGVEFSGS